MKTIIPSELRFDVNLNDLPSRAIQISQDELGLSGGLRCQWLGRNVILEKGISRATFWSIANQACPGLCRSYNHRFNTNRRYRARRRNSRLQCSCCF